MALSVSYIQYLGVKQSLTSPISQKRCVEINSCIIVYLNYLMSLYYDDSEMVKKTEIKIAIACLYPVFAALKSICILL